MYADMTYGQVDLSCEQFCLSKKTVCNCTVNGSSLTWEVVHGSDDIGQRNVIGSDLNKSLTLLGPDPSIASSFEIIVTQNTSEKFIATMSFITLSEYQGYDITCKDSSTHSFTIPITIPGIN